MFINRSKLFFNGFRLQALIVLLTFCLTIEISAQNSHQKQIPEISTQLILVFTDSLTASHGWLYRFEREDSTAVWQMTEDKISVVLGRNGLAWGIGLHQLSPSMEPRKREGDGKSPAGFFTMSAAFGYADPAKLADLKFPYFHNTKMLECIDDPKSVHYNRLVYRNKIENVDWQSSEKMGSYGIWYQWGVVVDHNKQPTIKGAGSCIFLHNWSKPDETTAGCTEMSPANMKKIVFWLDESRKPILVQLTRSMLRQYKNLSGLKLPPLSNENDQD